MKRLLVCILAAMICLSLLAACGNTQNTGGDAQNSQSSSGEVTVEEQTIFDDQGIKAVVKGLGKYEGEMMSFDRALLIDVTNSTEKNFVFGLSHCSVNGYMIDSNYSYTIEAGKTDTYPGFFDSTKLEALGITTIADFEFCIVAEDEETYETLIESDPISVKTSAYEGFEYSYDENGTVLYDADGIKIIAQDLEEDEYLGPGVKIYVANNTDKGIAVGVASGSVNGKEVNDFSFGADPAAGKHSIELLSIGDEERPEKIESLTLSFSIYDWDTGDAIVEKTEPVTVTF